MLTRAVNGFTEEEIKAALRGENRPPEFRVRFDLHGFDNVFIRELKNIQLEGSEITHNYFADIKSTARFRVIEANLDLDPYSDIVIADGPLIYWRYGETSGGTANDSSGNGRAGTIAGTVGYSQPSLLAAATENTAFSFLAANSPRVKITDAAWMDVTNISLEGWMNTSLISAQQRVWGRGGVFTFKTDVTTGFLRMEILIGGTVRAFISSANIVDGQDHHLVGTYDGTTACIYVDSILVLKSTAFSGPIGAGTTQIVSGCDTGETAFNTGKLDELAIYDRALTSTEVRTHYQAGSGDLAEIDYYRDRIKPYVAIKMDRDGTDGTPWAEYPRYLFLLEAPSRVSDESTIVREVDGFDQTVILKNNRTTARYTIASGTNYITAVGAALTAAGLDTTGYQLTPTSKTLPAAQDWPIGTPYLRIVNDLLGAINYRGFRFDSNGLGVAEPYVLPGERSSEYTYETNADSVVLKGIQSVVQTIDVPNVVVLARVNPDTDTLTSTQTNNKVSSPTSVPRRGNISIVLYEEVTDAADQTTLDNMAKRRLTEVSEVLQYISFSTWLHPFHDDADKITFINQALNINADFIHVEWVLPLNEIERMTHRARLSVSVV